MGLDPGAGKTFYVCDCGDGAVKGCKPGDDAAAGSKDAPWRTYQKARTTFGTLAPGDAIAFCRGGAFAVDGSAGVEWTNGRCKADKPCIVRDYSPDGVAKDAQRPKLAFKDRYGFRLENGGDAEHEEGYVFLNLIMTGTPNGNGFFFYNDIDDVLMCNLVIDGFKIGVQVAGSNPAGPGSDGLNERIVLRNSVVTNSPTQGWLGACNGCAVEYSTFKNNGFEKKTFNHNIYFSGSSGGTAMGMRAVGNDLYQSALIDGRCMGVSLVVHGKHDGLVIDANTIHEDVGAADQECWGIAMDSGYDEPESFRNVTIQNNVVINVGNLGIGLNACSDCIVQNNIVYTEQSAYGTIGIASPDRDGNADDATLDRVTVRNNSLYYGKMTSGMGISVGGQGSGHIATNNAIHFAGSDPTFKCFNYGLETQSYEAIDHNLCFTPNASSVKWESRSGSLDAWQQASGFDANSQQADPLFATPEASKLDLTPRKGSPLIGSGDKARSPEFDQQGKSRGDRPSIGALEP